MWVFTYIIAFHLAIYMRIVTSDKCIVETNIVENLQVLGCGLMCFDQFWLACGNNVLCFVHKDPPVKPGEIRIHKNNKI